MLKPKQTIQFTYNLGVDVLGLPVTVTHTFKSWDF